MPPASWETPWRGTVSRSQGTYCSFSLSWKGKLGVENQNQNVELGAGLRCEPVEMACVISWEFFFPLHNDDLKFATRVGVTALLPRFWLSEGVDPCCEPPRRCADGGTNCGETLCLFSIACVHGTQIWVWSISDTDLTDAVISVLSEWADADRWCGGKVMRHLRNHTQKQFYCPTWPFFKKIKTF